MSCLEEKPTEEDLEFMRKVCEQLSDAVDVIVKRLDLPDNKVVHVIKFEEKPFVVRSEISALLWDADLLRSMVSYFMFASPVMVYGCYRRKSKLRHKAYQKGENISFECVFCTYS